MIRIILIILLSASSVIAESNNYWAIEIPVVEGATNVSRERDSKFFVISSSSYEVVISDTQKIYDFYKNFFETIGWENPMKDFPRSMNEYQGKWSSYRSALNHEGFPESSYSSMWKAENVPAMGTVNLTLTDFKDGKFKAKVKVSLSPNVDTSPLFQLQKLMMGNPKNIFILYEATGGNPLEIDKISPRPLKKYKDNKMVKEYYELIEKIFIQYQDFGDKYIQ